MVKIIYFDFNYCFYSCDKYIKINSNNMKIWNNKGYYLMLKKKYKEALEW